MQKLAHINFSSTGWQRPSGDAHDYEAEGTYNQQFGFGHEDWLFRSEWNLDGWRYAFLQGVNKSHRLLLEEGVPFDVTLFTIRPDKKRHFVATIRDVECLSEWQANQALQEFKDRGWYAQMKQEIEAVGGNPAALEQWEYSKHILNIRFRESNVWRDSSDANVPIGPWINKYTRYQLNEFDRTDTEVGASLKLRKPVSPSQLRLDIFLRRATGTIECTPEHARMQAKLHAELKKEYPDAEITLEENFVDVMVRTPSELLIFELKSDLNPSTVLRLAMGQLLEYAYRETRVGTTPIKLFAVGRQPLSTQDQMYMNWLQEQIKLPLGYRVVHLDEAEKPEET